MLELERFAADYKRRAAALEREQDRLREERDDAIMRACERGVPQTTIADTLAISQQLVSKVIPTRRQD
jgi:hypothetical protein